MASVSYVATGTAGIGTTSASPVFPAGIRKGDILILAVTNKYPTNGPSTPSGWTAPAGNQATGGSGTAGIDSGDIYITVFYKVADGTETGNQSVTVTSGNSTVAQIVCYRPSIANNFSTFSVECQSGSDNTVDTSWSVTTGSLDVEPGDMVVACSGINYDNATWSAQAITLSGATFDTANERTDSPTTQGDDCKVVISDHPVSSGTADAAATYTMTASGTTTNGPAGATVLVRIREVEASLAAALFQQETSVLTIPPGQARLTQQETSVLTVPPGQARLTQQEASALIRRPVTAYWDEVRADTPWAFWPLNDVSGSTTIQDWSGNGRHATVGGTITFEQSGTDVAGAPSVDVENGGGYAIYDYGSSKSWTDLTVEFWLNPESLVNYNQMIVAGGTGNGWGWFLMHAETGTSGVYVGTDQTTRMVPADTAGTLFVATWTHIVFTYTNSSSTGRLYRNGELVYEKSSMTAPAANRYYNLLKGMGAGADGLDGLANLIAVYESALSQTRIKTHYRVGIGGVAATTVQSTAAVPTPAGVGSPDATVTAVTVDAVTSISGTASVPVAAVTVAATTTISGSAFTPVPAVTVAAMTTISGSAFTPVPAVTVAATATVPAPTVSVDDSATVNATTVAGTTTADAVTVTTGSTVSATTVAGSTSVSGAAFTPAAGGTVAAATTVGTVTVTTDSIVPASTVAATTTIGTPSVGEPAAPATVQAVTTIPTPLPPRLRYVGTGTESATTTTLSPTVPSGAVGDWLLLMVGVKGGTGPSVNTAGWTELTGAAGTSTNGTAITTDVGDTTTRAYIKKATATSETVSVSAGGTVVGIAKVFRFATEPGYNPIFSAVFIDDPTGDTTFGGTSAGSLSVDAGTVLIAAGFIPTDAGFSRFSAQSVSISGATISLTEEALDGSTSAGLDLGTTITRHTVTAGPGSGTVTYAATQGTGTNGYGAIAVVAVSALPIVVPDTVVATTTIATPVVRELVATATGTMGGLTDVTEIAEDRLGWAAAITSPVDGSLVTSGGITVAGYVYAADNLEAELHVQVSTSSVFATILDTQFSAPVDLDELATVSLSGLVAGTTYYLRARAGHSATDEWGDWTDTVTVTANVDVGNGYAYLYASDVDTSVPTPHIWWTIYDPETDTITVVGTGFGATQGTYNGELWADYEPGGTVELTPTSWTTDADTGNATTGDRTIVYGTSSDPSTTTIVANAPTDVDDRGLGVYVDTTGGGGTTGGTVVSYPADIPADRTNTGWWVEVRDFFNPDTIITTIHTFKSLSFTKPLNDAGTGEIVMDRNDPFFDILLTPVTGDEDEGKQILTFALYFSFMQDGAERFRMVYDGKARDRAKASEPETVTLSGTGRAVELSWGVVLPNSWPADVKAHPRKRDNQTWAPLFIKLFNEAQNRGEIPDTITLGFTDTHDSYGVLWTDQLGESDREVEIGTTLFDLIQTWGDAEEFDWIVTPRGRLIAAPVLGQDLTMDVRFFNAVTNNEVAATEDRKDIRTRVYVEGTNGHISYTEGEYPIARWGVRAMYLRSDQARSERQRIRVARGTLRQTRRPARERMVKVPYEHLDPVTGESYGRTVFVDYGLGDIIGFGPRIDNETGMPRAARDVRVAEIGISVSTEGIDVELTMETRNERFEERVRRLLAARLGEWSSAKTAKVGKGSVTNARDTDVDGVVTGDTIIWDRDAELWKSGRPTDVWPFFFSGALYAVTSKMYFVCDHKRTIRRITARLGDTSTSGPVTIALKRNNATVHTMNIAAGSTRNRDIVTINVTEDDELSIDVLDPGVGAGYLQVVVEAG